MQTGNQKIQTLENIKDRFKNKVRITDNGCHEWQGAKQSNGYGRFNPFGKSMYAHRFAALMKYGILHNNQDVCHVCDNRLCVNPDHLFIGSRKDNMQDCVAKKRHAYGSRLSKKLTEQDVVKIRKLLSQGMDKKDIAMEFNVTTGCIEHIHKRNTWRHI